MNYTSVAETMEVWRARNQCTDAAPEVSVQGDTRCEAWTCAAATELCSVEGFGHAWPGGRNAQHTDADATVAAWTWFQQVAVRKE